MKSTVGVDLRGWDDAWGKLPSKTFDLIPRTQLWFGSDSELAPQFTLQPQSISVPFNDTATFYVEATGAAPLEFRWLKDGRYLGDDFLISGSRTTTLRIRNVKAYDIGKYSVEIRNLRGCQDQRPGYFGYPFPR